MNKKRPRPLSLVVFVGKFPEMCNYDTKGVLTFLGEIPNMPGHCVVVDQSGKVESGCHIFDFEEFDDENEKHLKILNEGRSFC